MVAELFVKPVFYSQLIALILLSSLCQSQIHRQKVLGLFTAKDDAAHISFVNETNEWFKTLSADSGFIYEFTNDWNRLNDNDLKSYDLLIFLDTRPEKPLQRKAFEKYMKDGGAWMGFHFSAFALNNSLYPQDWDWYHNEFLGSGEYASNTWRPTSALLKIELKHPVTHGLIDTISASPNEWYRWKNDLRENKNIQILLSIDERSFPLGTGPKPHEIWHSGYYPVVWTNTNYRMVYFNMGHNDIDYEGKTNKSLSFTFGNKAQDQLVINAVSWLLNNHTNKGR